MKIAICSLSTFTYVAECLDLAAELSRTHEVRYVLGFRSEPAVALLESRGLSYDVILDGPPVTTGPAHASSTRALFTEFFVRQADAVLPGLVRRLKAWGAGLVLAHLRDFAGINAADICGIPVVSFGSHASPVRVEPDDPPFGSGLAVAASDAQRRLLWRYDREFHAGLDEEYNARLRRPYGLAPIAHASTHASDRLVLLSVAPSLGRLASTPAHVRCVGPLFSNAGVQPTDDERAMLARIDAAPRPRVFVSLGTTYGASLLPRCLEALHGFDGTIVASGSTERLETVGLIAAPFFSDVHRVLRACDAVVSVCGGKTLMDALSHGLPVVGLPQQGEQKDLAVALQHEDAALLPCLRKWDAAAFASAVSAVVREPQCRHAALRLKAEVEASGGVTEAVRAVNEVLCDVVR